MLLPITTSLKNKFPIFTRGFVFNYQGNKVILLEGNIGMGEMFQNISVHSSR